MKIDITCPQCGTVSAKEVRKVNEARKAGLPIYCSAACSHAAKRTPKITIMCQQCGKEMLLPPSIAVKTYYCSIACRSAWDRSRYINRFWQNVEKTKDCWEWRATCDHQGYGDASYQGSHIRAHRLSWIIHFGNIPSDMMILHRCDNPPCVRPDHLFLGDAGDNARDRVQKGRFIHLNRGENSGRAKLSETQALDIIADKRSAKILAGEYGSGLTP